MKNLQGTLLGIVAVLHSAAASPVQVARNASTNSTANIWDFSLLQSSPSLQWVPCFDAFTCTVLEVPLDYSDSSAGTTGIAFIKWAAKNASANDILINPGGPGGSGVATVQQNLVSLQRHLGTANNIVGFDPRGVNNSGPSVSCFPRRKDTIALYDLQLNAPVDSTSASALTTEWARAGSFGQWCNDAHNSSSTAKYVNTVATATDMLHYAELAAEAKGQKKEEAKVWYYGESYGTFLGSTFANLFPQRVGRLILDGVVDAEDYYQGKWKSNTVDTDATIYTFFDDCFAAGKEGCAFWDESPEIIRKRFDAVVEDITASPIIVTNRAKVPAPMVITIMDLKTYMIKIPYNPIITFPELATVLAGLEKRNGDYFACVNGRTIQPKECGLPSGGSQEPALFESTFFIGCNDAGGRYNLSTMDIWTDHVESQVNQSKWRGEQWSTLPLLCRLLDISNYVPESQKLKGSPSAANTSSPILFISTKLDPATPLRSAEKMTALFGGSGLLVQNSAGHASISAFSKCTHNAIESYLADATLPPNGMVCEPDEIPFKVKESDIQARSLMRPMR